MKRIFITPEQWKCILFIILLVFGFFIPSWWEWLNSRTTLSFDIEYNSDCIFGIGTPVEGLDILIYVDSVYSETITTDSLGQATYMIQGGEVTYSYVWQSVGVSDVAIDESINSLVEVELKGFLFATASEFTWEDTSLYNGDIDLYLDGVFVATKSVVAGTLTGVIEGLTLGTWSYENQSQTEFTLIPSMPDTITHDVMIIPKGIMISIIINQKPTRIIISILNQFSFFFFISYFGYILKKL